MWFPVVGYQFDTGNCDTCDYFRHRQKASLGVFSS